MNFDSKNVMSFAINAIDSLTRTAMKEKYGDDCKIMFGKIHISNIRLITEKTANIIQPRNT